jgi:hypothetical protein
VVTVDGDTYFAHYYSWLATLFSGDIAPGDTRVCHFRSALSASAPPVVALTFHPVTHLVDVARVSTPRRFTCAGGWIPFLSAGTSVALMGLIALIGILGVRIRNLTLAADLSPTLCGLPAAALKD